MNAIIGCSSRLPRHACLRTARALAATLLLVLVVAAIPAQAQYFGRNKVHYEDFDFRILMTRHFDVHYYPQEDTAARDAARMAERWYSRYVDFFAHDFSYRKPIIFYANQGDFQQTNVIDEEISEGTGGFTEPLQDRVVLPLTGSYAANDHVIGHELVHAFQYDIVQREYGREGLQRMGQLPLWFIEGMAEYLSLGRDDPNTAMWMRDAVLRDKIPTIDDVTSDPRYFPYRYGQAIWAYIAGRWGDDMVPKLFRASLSLGWEMAAQRLLGVDEETLSKSWAAALKAQYGAEVAARTKPADIGKRLLSSDGDAEAMNVSPALSPDGKYAAFLSSRDIFSIDLYLADVATGKVITRLVTADFSPHLDALRFINSAGSWSADGRKFATIVYADGDDELAVIDIASRSVERRIRVKDVGEISNPSWSPDGTQLVFSGSRGGISDLYTVQLATLQIKRLTNDRNADFQPVFSPDGSTIAFVTDRGPETDFDALRFSAMRLALYDVKTGTVTVLPRFETGKNINPQFSPDGRDLYFVADRDGFSDIYRYTLAGGQVSRVTNVATGVSGITEGSPALSVARTSGLLAVSLFDHGEFMIRLLDPPALKGAPAADSTAFTGGTLPPTDAKAPKVMSYLSDEVTGLPSGSGFIDTTYSAALRLAYLGAPMFGASVSSYGTSFIGGISAYFTDILGYHQLATTLQVNGELKDIGGQVEYLYTRNRWNWGANASHVPYTSYAAAASSTTYEPPGQPPVPAIAYDQFTQRVFEDQVGLLGQYPFSTALRFEMNAGFTHIGYSLDLQSDLIVDNVVVQRIDTSLPSPPGLNLLEGSVALVGDNSVFGYTSPVRGQRFRAEVGGTAGSLRFATLLLDYRRYFFVRPVTFAFRGYHMGRYGADGQSDLITPLFLGYPTNVRGYESNSFESSECTQTNGSGCPEFDRLLGSRIALASAELRAPLFGTGGYGLIPVSFLPIELAAFVDGGLAWSPGSGARLVFAERTTDRVPVFSAGFSARVNVLGYFVAEFYYARPFQRPDAGWQWGFNIAPGW